jgi:hypothetical protein
MVMIKSAFLVLLGMGLSSAFCPASNFARTSVPLQASKGVEDDSNNKNINNESEFTDRRSFVTALVAAGAIVITPSFASAEEVEEEGFAAIAARASRLSSDVGELTPMVRPKSDDPRTAYDFQLPVAGEQVSMMDLVHQEVGEDGISKVKCLLVCNMKEDDPIARKDIPEFISLAAK